MMFRNWGLLPVLSLALFASGAEEVREWHDKKGNAIEAAFVKEEGGVVTLTRKDGVTVQAKMDGLCEEDCVYIREVTYVPQEIPVVFKRDVIGIRFSESGTSKPATIRDTVVLQLAESGGAAKPAAQGDTTWKIESVDAVGNKILPRKENVADELTTDGKFVFVTYLVKNDSQTPVEVPTPVLHDKQGRKFSQAERGLSQYYIPEGALCAGPGSDPLQPGFKKLFCSFYELPTDAVPAAVEVFPSFMRQLGPRQLMRGVEQSPGKRVELNVFAAAAAAQEAEPAAATYGKTSVFMRCTRVGQSGDSSNYWYYDRSKKRSLAYGVEMRILGNQPLKAKVKAFFIGAGTGDHDLVVDTKEVEVALLPGKIARATLQSEEIEEQSYYYYSSNGRERVSGAKLKGVIIQTWIDSELAGSWVSLNQWKKYADLPDVAKTMGELKKSDGSF